MPAAIRFHLDENVDHAVAQGLRLRGIDVTTTTDALLSGAPDQRQLDFARQHGRVLVTHDRDFLHSDFAREAHAGVVYCAMESRGVGYLVRYLTLMHDCLSPAEMHNAVEFC